VASSIEPGLNATSGSGFEPLLDWMTITDVLDSVLAPTVLALALGSSRPETRIQAAEIAAAAVALHRLPADRLAAAVHDFARTRMLKLGRVTDSLRLIGEHDAGAAWAVSTELIIRLIPDPPRDTAAVLEAGADFAATVDSREVPAGLRELAMARGNTKLLIQARRLVKIMDPESNGG
jgi:hypothetical protein